MLKIVGATLLIATGATLPVTSVLALDAVVTNVDKNKDGSLTYHFVVKTEAGETLTAGDAKTPGDFVTVYNFYGYVDGSAKAPAGWTFSSEEFGRTPTSNGYPTVLPLDVPNTPNLTWTVTKPVAAGSQTEGFSATTRVATMVQGQYSAQVTRQMPAIPGDAAVAAKAVKQALLGSLPTPHLPRRSQIGRGLVRRPRHDGAEISWREEASHASDLRNDILASSPRIYALRIPASQRRHRSLTPQMPYLKSRP